MKEKGKPYSTIIYLEKGKFSLTSYRALQTKLSKSDHQKSEKSEISSKIITTSAVRQQQLKTSVQTLYLTLK